ncbi:MAG: FecCD family ABC transporter permease [Coriobacteriales bacterium]|jgi:iron complex transport system permease protein
MPGNISLEQGGNIYAQGSDRRLKMRDKRANKVVKLAVICVVVLLVMVVFPDYLFYYVPVIGSTEVSATNPLTWAEFLRKFTANVSGLLQVCTGSASYAWTGYLCEFVIVAVSGCAMALCGSVYQSAFRNPLAAPKTLGVMEGGAVGVLFWLQLSPVFLPVYHNAGWATNLADYWEWYYAQSPFDIFMMTYGQGICGVIGCLVVVGIVVGISALVGHGKLSNITLIIVGQVFVVGVTALLQFVRYVYNMSGDTEAAMTIEGLQTATFTGMADPQSCAVTCIPILICVAIIMLMRHRLMLLSFGDEEARSMGLSTNRMRYAMIFVCTVMVGWTVSFCGHIAFLGFITAHLSRKIIGSEVRYLLPGSCFVGATFILVVHKITRMGFVFAPMHSDGMWTAILGASFFLIYALRQRKETRGDWL